MVVESYEEYKEFINKKLNIEETLVEVYVKGFDEVTYKDLSSTNRGYTISYSQKNGNAWVKITFN